MLYDQNVYPISTYYSFILHFYAFSEIFVSKLNGFSSIALLFNNAIFKCVGETIISVVHIRFRNYIYVLAYYTHRSSYSYVGKA